MVELMADWMVDSTAGCLVAWKAEQMVGVMAELKVALKAVRKAAQMVGQTVEH